MPRRTSDQYQLNDRQRTISCECESISRLLQCISDVAENLLLLHVQNCLFIISKYGVVQCSTYECSDRREIQARRQIANWATTVEQEANSVQYLRLSFRGSLAKQLRLFNSGVTLLDKVLFVIDNTDILFRKISDCLVLYFP